MAKMKEIIESAVRGGYDLPPNLFFDTDCVCDDEGNAWRYEEILMKSDFWKALGKECGWVEDMHDEGMWLDNATEFHRINLTEGLTSAISWLSALTGKE